MLKGVQAQRGYRGRIRMAEDSEYPTFLAQAVAISLQIRLIHGHEILRLVLHRYRVPVVLGCVRAASSERWSGPASGVS